MPEENPLPVEIISPDQLAKVTAGMKTGKKENPKPLVEKVAEAKPPYDDAVGKISEKPAGRDLRHGATASAADTGGKAD